MIGEEKSSKEQWMAYFLTTYAPHTRRAIALKKKHAERYKGENVLEAKRAEHRKGNKVTIWNTDMWNTVLEMVQSYKPYKDTKSMSDLSEHDQALFEFKYLYE